MRTCFILGVLLLAALSFRACTKSSTQDAQQKNVESASHEQHQTEEEYYTCPMHPSVRSDRPGACPVCNMALVKKTKQKDLNPTIGQIPNLDKSDHLKNLTEKFSQKRRTF